MRLKEFRVENYRSIRSTDWINVCSITAFVGQNEAGKSNLCEALFRINPYVPAAYVVDEDWPVDNWGGKDPNGLVCEARFELTDPTEISILLNKAGLAEPNAQAGPGQTPNSLILRVSKFYDNKRKFHLEATGAELDASKVEAWANEHLPKCVYIQEYDFPGSRTELTELMARRNQKKWHELSVEDQTILIVLDLARVNIDEFIKKGQSPEGRTLRSFDKRQASAYLTQQFSKLWNQKEVRFDIDIDASTLNIFVEDKGVGMPVRLDKRSTGFRWYVAFAWKFTHATKGNYKNTILILEEPGIHLHYDAHRDLLKILDDLSLTNTILYTTHVATMLDPAYPERVRIVEVHDHHSRVVEGVVSGQRVPMMLIEARLGLSADMSGLLGSRQTLVVEGGDDALILQKLSGLLQKAGKHGLSERIYLWPAQGASKTPMYAGFLVGHKFDAGVLLDSDEEGQRAKAKIKDLYLRMLAAGQKFHVFMLKEAAGISKNEPAIEDVFPDEWYLGCVNAAYRVIIKPEDLPQDGSDQITKRVEFVLRRRHGREELDKGMVMSEMLRRFDEWQTADDLPPGTAEKAETLFKRINRAFE